MLLSEAREEERKEAATEKNTKAARCELGKKTQIWISFSFRK